MPHEELIQVKVSKQVGIVTLHRPKRAHAYTQEMLAKINTAIDELVQAKCVAVLFQSSGDGAFCGGADLHEMERATPADALKLRSQTTFNKISDSPFISVAAVQGAAVAGGCELALACDIRIVGPKGSFSLPETSLSIIPAAGGTTRLTALVGASVAKQVILGGRVIDAQEALNFGLVMEIHDSPKLRGEELCLEMVSRDCTAMMEAKTIIDSQIDRESLRLELLAQAVLYRKKSVNQK